MFEKNTTPPRSSEIEFTWEQVSKKAHAQKARLETSTANITKREQAVDIESHVVSEEMLPVAGPTSQEVDIAIDAHEPDRNAVELLKGIKEKTIMGKELTQDERRMVVKSLRELGQTQDAMAELLQVSRRTIVSDFKVIRRQQALEIQQTETHDIAGEVFAVGNTCIRRALQAGHFKTVSTVLRDMVELLQSLGVVYRAPKTSMQASLVGNLEASRKGYSTYMQTIGEDKSKVVNILDCLFETINKGDL